MVSFGGYIALPISIIAFFARIPVLTHEQTLMPGLANRIIGAIAQSIAVSFPETASMFGREKAVVTGLPIRTSVLHAPKKAPLPIPGTFPLLLIAGGSTGSVSVNDLVFPILPNLLKQYVIVHQVGKLSIEKAKKISESLPEDLKKRYFPVAYLSADEFSWALHTTSLFIGRSGANTVTEVAMTGVPAVWIPLPWAARNEQMHNAFFLKERGTSVIVDQRSMSSASLLQIIQETLKEKKHKIAALKLASELPTDGASHVVQLVEKLLQQSRS